MKHTCLGTHQKYYLLYLEKGDKINESIEDFCQSHNIAHASFTGIGAITNIDLAQYQTKEKTYSHNYFDSTHELVSLIGNFSYIKNDNEQDRWFAHTHISISNKEAITFGGHLFEAEVAAVVEIYLTAYEKPLLRKYNDDIGLNTMLVECKCASEGHHGQGCCHGQDST